MSEGRTRDEDGKFIKGQTPYKGGRKSKAAKEKEEADEVWFEILREADGDPLKLLELSLKRGAELRIPRSEGFKLARELAPYKAAKRATEDKDGNTQLPMNFQFNGIPINGTEGDIKLIEGAVDDSEV